MAITIDDYFKNNGITPKHTSHASPEHLRITEIDDNKEYFDQYFQAGLDDFIECVDFHMNRQMFGLLLAEARKYSDIFEPCCQSGLFGCYAMLNSSGTYLGADINPYAILKARRRAVANSLPESRFVQQDVRNYPKQHEAIVGRYVINTSWYEADHEMIDAIARISDNILLVQPSKFFCGDWTSLNAYREAFKKHGYEMSLLQEKHIQSEVTGAYMFAIKATRKMPRII